MKGITPVVAVILLLLITIAIVGFVSAVFIRAYKAPEYACLLNKTEDKHVYDLQVCETGNKTQYMETVSNFAVSGTQWYCIEPVVTCVERVRIK